MNILLLVVKHSLGGAKAGSGVRQDLASGLVLPNEGPALKLAAQNGMRYELLDQDTGALVPGQRLVRSGKSLHVYLNKRRVLELDGFYEASTEGQLAAQYQADAGDGAGRWIEGGDVGLAQSTVPEAPLEGPSASPTPLPASEAAALPSASATGSAVPAAAAASPGPGSLLAAGLGLAALAGGGGGGGAGATAAPRVPGTVVSGTFVGGPAVPGNGLTVAIYDLDGHELGSAKVSDSGMLIHFEN